MLWIVSKCQEAVRKYGVQVFKNPIFVVCLEKIKVYNFTFFYLFTFESTGDF